LNNWAITVGLGQEYERAIDLLEQGICLDPHYETFAANYVHLYYQWSEALCTQQNYDEALDVLREANPAMLGSDRLFQLRKRIYRRWARQMIQEGKSRQALQLMQTADAECRPASDTLLPIETGPFADKPGSLSGNERLLERGLDRQPQSRLLKEH
jgi:tetratricopeptide (TPR) repeat protein